MGKLDDAYTEMIALRQTLKMRDAQITALKARIAELEAAIREHKKYMSDINHDDPLQIDIDKALYSVLKEGE